ncbi:MAG: hypothetical protein ACRDSE_14300 [Pseudonocardiaceae bacterium]
MAHRDHRGRRAPPIHPRLIGRAPGGTLAGAPVIGWVAGVFGPRWSLLGGGILTIASAALAGLLFLRSTGTALRPSWRPRPWLTIVRPDDPESEDDHGDGDPAPGARAA